MKYDEIIKLLDAGYSRDEILNMQDEPAPEEKQKPAPEEKQKPAPEEKSEPAPVNMDAIMSEVKDMFAEMKKELTAMNILNSRQKAEESKTSDDILANIINPTLKSGGSKL